MQMLVFMEKAKTGDLQCGTDGGHSEIVSVWVLEKVEYRGPSGG